MDSQGTEVMDGGGSSGWCLNRLFRGGVGRHCRATLGFYELTWNWLPDLPHEHVDTTKSLASWSRSRRPCSAKTDQARNIKKAWKDMSSAIKFHFQKDCEILAEKAARNVPPRTFDIYDF